MQRKRYLLSNRYIMTQYSYNGLVDGQCGGTNYKYKSMECIKYPTSGGSVSTLIHSDQHSHNTLNLRMFQVSPYFGHI